MCGSMWECVGACGSVWVEYVEVCGCIRECVGACGDVWVHVGVCGCMQECVGACGCMWECVGVCSSGHNSSLDVGQHSLPPSLPPSPVTLTLTL